MRIQILGLLVLLVLSSCGGGGGSGNDGSLRVYSVNPRSGPMAGDQPVNIDGIGFNVGVTSVRFGNRLATDVVVTSDQNINCTTPRGTAGSVDVTVSTADGQQVTAEDAYVYNQPPQVLFVTPVAGPAGLTVSVLGRNFSDGTLQPPTVAFGGVDSVLPQLVSNGLIFATTPPNPNGTVDVSVTNANGTDTQRNAFTYILGPVLRTEAPAARTPEQVRAEGYAHLEHLLDQWARDEGPLMDLDETVREQIVDFLIVTLRDRDLHGR